MKNLFLRFEKFLFDSKKKSIYILHDLWLCDIKIIRRKTHTTPCDWFVTVDVNVHPDFRLALMELIIYTL